MKKVFFCFALCFSFFMNTASCQSAAKTATKTATKVATKTTPQVAQNTTPKSGDLSIVDFQKSLSADNTAIILDVRTPAEYANGHLANATTINFFDTDFKEKVNKLDKTKAIYVYCAVGGRSAKALKILQEAGFKTAYNMLGGFTGWQAAGLPSVK